MAYRHGVFIDEVPTSILPPVRVASGLPVVFGAAPVNMTDDPAAYVNKPFLAYTYAEAVAALGFVDADPDGYFNFGLCEFMKSHFALFSSAPVVFVNLLDPATHKESLTAVAATFVNDQAVVGYQGVLLSTVVVKNSGGSLTYVAGVDYELAFNDNGNLVVNRIAGGSILAGAVIAVDFDHLEPTMLTASDYIGGVDPLTGVATGLELIEQVFPRFRMVPGIIVAPQGSTYPDVAAVMAAKSNNINGHFKAISLVDIPTQAYTDGQDFITKYQDVAEYKNDNNLTDPMQMVCWPMVKLGGSVYHMSTQLAGLICKVDGQNADIPYRSPSNNNLQMDSAVIGDDLSEVFMGPDQAAYLNGEGVITALNFIGGWKSWGNRTAAYPASTDPKDTFMPTRRMFNWVGNTLTTTFWQRLDYPLNRRQIQTLVDSANIWLNGLVAQQYLIGARVEFLDEENTTTNLLDGIARFHVYMTPPSPNREIDFVLEYDATYLTTLFG